MQVLAEDDVTLTEAAVEMAEQVERHQREPRERVTRGAARLVVLRDRTAHEHPARRPREARGEVGGQRGQAVALHQHGPAAAAPQLPERPQRKSHAPGRADDDVGLGRLADGTAAGDRAGEHRQPGAPGEPLDQACVGAAFHDEADRRRAAGHLDAVRSRCLAAASARQGFSATVSACRPKGFSQRDRSISRIGGRPGNGR